MKRQVIHPILIVLSSLAFTACDKPASAPPSNSAIGSTNSPTTASKANPDLEKLVGKWERPDGGYVLEIRGVDAEGKVDAGYFNPSPIHVERGRAYREGGATKLFIELRDVNYPGCTYKLEFNAKDDQLVGQYFQATMQQTYEVGFARQK